MSHTTLVDTATLAHLVGHPDVAIVDCRFDLRRTEWGEQAYLERHIPGAVYADLERHLTGERTGGNGRHPLPDPAALVLALGRLGIDERVQVIAYDQDSGMFASRLWWLLRWMGHDAVAVLDGGFAKWLAEERDTTSGHENRPARTFSGRPRATMTATASDVAAAMRASHSRLLDARAPERYRGDVEPLDPVAGHIPGAANHFFQQNLSESGGFRAVEELRDAFESSLAGVPPEQVICYCGSGVTACHNLLAMEHAGLGGARLYAGSWSEWVADPARPVERG